MAVLSYMLVEKLSDIFVVINTYKVVHVLRHTVIHFKVRCTKWR